MNFPLKNGTNWELPDEMYKYFDGRYPLVDIDAELHKMQGWLECDPPRRKTAKGMKRAINFWLSSDKYGTQAKRKPKQNKDSQYEGICGAWLPGKSLLEMQSNDRFMGMLSDSGFRSWAEDVNVLVRELR